MEQVRVEGCSPPEVDRIWLWVYTNYPKHYTLNILYSIYLRGLYPPGRFLMGLQPKALRNGWSTSLTSGDGRNVMLGFRVQGLGFRFRA